ncbi:hypothetical protein KP509_10G050700 [Ceratopteris richardii]|uniref:Cysteine proteinase inhibitor n=1 Tax=Ceratopteris richardii TaxID=49495 RepID=A0A8T2TZ90_CERRI|nr:hypothetical protein KP509_10G050700 [Ceratopteris richardii]
MIFTPMKISFLLLLLALSLATVATAIPGGREKIPNAQDDPEIHRLAVFAVNKYNSQKGLKLKLAEVVSGEQQVVAGMMYYLVIKVSSKGHITEYYEAQIWVQAWRDFESLESFKKITKPNKPRY